MKVLLLEPLIDEKIKWGSFKVEKGYIPPLGMIALYSYLLAKNIPVRFIDTQFGDFFQDDIARILKEDREITVIGIPVFTNSAWYSFQTAAFCKQQRPDVTIVLGGVHATSLPERTLLECQAADYLVIGEGELTLHDLCVRIRDGRPVEDIAGIAFRRNGMVIINPPRPLIQNLDDLPMARYDDIDMSRYVPHPTQYRLLPNFPVVTQRGCPFQCTFCEASLVHGKKARRYSVERVIAELEMLIEKFGARGVYFQDSTFTLDKTYITELMEQMIKKNIRLQWACNTRCDRVDTELLRLMKRAGCWMISYGVESANQQSLDLLKKGTTVVQIRSAVRMTKDAGIALLCSYILALPGEDEDMIQKTLTFSQELLSDIALFYLPVPYPGSEFYQICRQAHSIRENASWEDFLSVDFSNPVYVSSVVSKDKMVYYYQKAYRDYYRNPRYLLKMLFSIHSLLDIRRYLRGMRAVISAFFSKNRTR